jgi:hypothetical protein
MMAAAVGFAIVVAAAFVVWLVRDTIRGAPQRRALFEKDERDV